MTTPELLVLRGVLKLLSWTEVTKENVLQPLEKLKTDKSTGPESINPGVLKVFKCDILALLTKTCRLKLATIPMDWKTTNVTS